MKFLKKIKSSRGVSLTDVAVAIIIIIILSGTVANMFYKLYYNTSMVRLNAAAINYAVNILEDIDRLPYEEIDNNLLIDNDYNLPDAFNATIDVKKYSDENPNKEDIIKIVTLTINYKLQDNEEEITLKKLKIKEF